MKFANAFRTGLKVLTTGVLLLAAQAATSAEIAPYFYTWGGKVSTLSQGKQLAGLSEATLAFAITNGNCAFDGAVDAMTTDIKSFTSGGGKVIISFGGASGTYIETACTDENQLFTAIDGLIQRTGVQRLDFDVEGSQLSSAAANVRRAHVLVRLLAKYPSMYISFTLPVEPSGLPTEAVNLLKTTVSNGVRINIVNIMTMDYGAGTSNLGSVAIQSSQGTFNQLKTIYPTKSTAEIYGMIGITPMIGKNDDGTVFSLADAAQVTAYAKQNGIGLLAYWAFQRDVAQASAGNSSLGSFSGVAQSDFQFYNTFKGAAGGVVVTPAPVPAPVPAPAPGVCSSTAWVQGKSYAVGSIVKFTDGKLYIATHANPGYSPVISTWYWSPYTCTTTSPAPAPAPAPVPAPAPAGVTWTKCADENGTCNFTGSRTIRYGAAGKFATLTLNGPVACTNETFGDPIVGIVKQCEISSATVASAPATTPARVPASNPVPAPVPAPVITGGQTMTNVYVTLYGYDDNDDGSGNYGVSVISNPIIHKGATEDLGTFDHPSTFATDTRVAAPGTKIYVPRLHKYFIMEDTCRECTTDKNAGKNHVDLYIGEEKMQGNPLIQCENALTKNADTIILNPPNNLPVSAPKIFLNAVCNKIQF